MPSTTTRTIALAGPDAAAFANAQLSSDVLALAPGHWQWSGWLDPKGRVRALLQVARVADDRFLLVPRGGDAHAFAQDLARFVFRSKVNIQVSDTLHASDGEAFDEGCVREEADGTLVFGEGDASLRIGAQAGSDAWIARHIAKGQAWLPDTALGTLLPPALSMERLGAVAFDKGCFPGQEIAARLHFLGGHKRHLHAARIEGDIALMEGQALSINGKEAGIVLMQDRIGEKPTTLVVLDDTMSQEETLDIGNARLHLLSTFAA
ncbi:YgfZ/GcvT domain-containing protein [Luteibacter yeojuensis]|uniref:Folate-binding protein n=1 Tax=Luteibacter yeojuensis TaxID=345309 RepID=A0A7X5TNX8_9GAMM|nr:folate-binding protein [Luteibacter yeojuensis]NID14435.1 folate-binding protein [Luteibacter yeojuensis]